MRLTRLTQSAIIASAMLAGSWAQADATRVSDTVISWDSEKEIGFTPLQPLQIPADKANMVFYRVADGSTDQSDVNLAINGRYLTSLSSGNYVNTVSCAALSLTSANETAMKSNDLTVNAQTFVLPVRTNQYFAVSVNGATASVERVEQAVALEAMQGMQLQTHMVDRTQASGCPDIPLPPVVAAPAEALALEDVYYFNFDVRTVDATEENRARTFAQKVVAADISNYLVYIAGFADPVGTDQYNDVLADDRAKDIVKLYIDSGIPSDRIQYRSFGENQPVVDCGAAANNALRNECNARNRRVDVQITTQE
jgi:OOP family OmpA-OmpF porin